MKLLVSGCSMTHGAELYNNFMHPNNVKLSYSQHIADALGIENLNVALSASSNEYIFHSLIENILAHDDIHSVIVMWTTTGRKYWKCNNRHYFVNGNFASSMVDPVNFEMHDKESNGVWITGDSDDIVNQLSQHLPFFITNYYDHYEEYRKLQHYSESLKALCDTKNLKLIELNFLTVDTVCPGVLDKQRHPDAIEHKMIAEYILNTYYEHNLGPLC